MKNYFEALQGCPLFAGIDRADMEALLRCLSSRQKSYAKNGFIWEEGGAAGDLGVVLSGSALILREDFWGRRKILTRIGRGGLFGEAFAFAGAQKLPFGVIAAEESDILFLNCRHIMDPCESACSFHGGLIKNLVLILADKNITLTQKLEHVTQPTTREKLLSYLSEQSRLSGSGTFDIPYSREELADYLSVERSAMSAELSRMRRDGLVDYNKNHFELLRKEN